LHHAGRPGAVHHHLALALGLSRGDSRRRRAVGADQHVDLLPADELAIKLAGADRIRAVVEHLYFHRPSEEPAGGVHLRLPEPDALHVARGEVGLLAGLRDDGADDDRLRLRERRENQGEKANSPACHRPRGRASG
jgi:hypothetical protein